MDTVQLNPRPVINSETNATELQGSARLLSMSGDVKENSNGNKYKPCSIAYAHNGVVTAVPGIIHEKSYTADAETGRVATKVGDIVAVNISQNTEDDATYYRVIGTGGSRQGADAFAALTKGLDMSKVSKQSTADADVPA